MKVKMLVDTTFKSMRLNAGQEVEVKAEVGQRWSKRNIATIIPDQQEQQAVNLKELTSKQAYELCKEHGLEVEPKQPKDVYVKLLEEAGI